MKNTVKFLSLSFILLIVAGCAQQVAPQQPVTNNTVNTAAPVMTQEQPAVAQTQNQQTVSIANYAFAPATVTVKAGTTVTWVNSDPVQHKILSDATPPSFGSDNIPQGGNYSLTFRTAGTFDYHCQIHPSMKGTIIVTP